MIIPVRVMKQAELYAGEPTGRQQFIVSRDGIGIYSAVLGRGYTRESAIEDFIRRANAESYTIIRVCPRHLEIQD